MAGEIIEAAARVICILGDGWLESSAAGLVRLARSAEVAAVGVGVDGVPLDNVKSAADSLSQADSGTRWQAVLHLLDAATALEGAFGDKLNALRGNASDLARVCREHGQATKYIEEMRRAEAGREEQRAEAGREEQREERRAAGPWWWLLLRRWVPRRPEEEALLAEEDPPPRQHSQTLQSEAIAAVELVAEKLAKRDDLVTLAGEILRSAHLLDVPSHDLARAKEALVGANNLSAAVAELGTAATDLEREATLQLRVLRAPVARLAHACLEHQQAAEAMEATKRAAEERARERENEERAQQERECADVTVQNEQPLEPAPAQGNELTSNCLGTALLGALTMLPYMGGPAAKDGLLKLEVLPRSVGVAFAWLWFIVGTGVPCLMVRHPFFQMVAWLLSRAGMLAATLLVAFYCHWSLAPDWTTGVWVLVGCAVAAYVALLGWQAWYEGREVLTGRI